MSEANTIWTKAYTPAGFQVGITIGFEAGTLPLAVDIDRQLQEAGYLLTLPGVEPGEDVEPILYVCRYIKFDEKKDREISHVAFYSENDNLVNRWIHQYMDTDEQIADFEAATGLKLDKMPVWGGDTHPAKNAPKAVREGVIVRLPKAIRIARETYMNKNGEPRHKLKRYVDSIGTPQTSTPSNVTALPQQTTNTNGSGKKELTWEEQVFEATAFLYSNHKHQTNSINALMKNEVISDKDKPVVSILSIIFHRAKADFGMDETKCKELLGSQVEGTVADFMKSVNGSYEAAWKVIANSQQKPQTDATEYSLPPTGTDDIPF